MANYVTKEDVIQQSKGALDSWGPRWENNAKANGETMRIKGHSHEELLLAGLGRTAVIVATGPSLEKSMPILKQYHDRVDVICCDKSFGFLMEEGICPRLVCTADAMINYEKYAKPWINKTQGIALMVNICGEQTWPRRWRGPVYFYVNKDNLKTEEKFMELSGCKQCIPASSNVGNTSVVIATQMMGYEKHLLIGYDFCWWPDSNYYAFHDHEEKRQYMKHFHIIDHRGRMAYTSNNLHFSARWLMQYLSQVKMANPALDVRDCSDGILLGMHADLERELARTKERELTEGEKLLWLNAHRTDVVLKGDDIKKLGAIVNDKDRAPAQVIVSLVPKKAPWGTAA